MKIVFTLPRHHSVPKTVAGLLLAALLGAHTPHAIAAARTPPDAIQELLDKAHAAPLETRAPHLLAAAELALQQNLPQHAERILRELDELKLSDAERARYTVLQAGLLVQQHQPERALALLQTREFQQRGALLSAPAQIDLSLLRARAFGESGNYFAAAQELIFVDPLLEQNRREQNRRDIQRYLSKVPAAELQAQRSRTSNAALRGWIDLALGGTAGAATAAVISSAPIVAPGSQMALLLPQSGRLAAFGNAVRDGFFNAWYAARARGELPPPVRVYDTENVGVVALYMQAVADGAALVIGPLEKNLVAQFYAQSLPVPLLALNRADSDQQPPPNLFQFSLAPEDETAQLAVFAARARHRDALVIASEDEARSRELQAFEQTFESQGGTIAAAALYRDQQGLSAAIRSALNIPRSEARAKEMENLLNRKIESAPHRRRDVDMVLMLASPAQARLIKPLLDFYYAGDLPIYSTSRIYNGYASPGADRDIEKVRFTDIPWVLQASAQKQQIVAADPASRNYLRLYALGIDSFALLQQLRQLESSAALRIAGQTGNLSLDSQRIVRRELPLAQMRAGTAQVIDGNGIVTSVTEIDGRDDNVERQIAPPQ